jgi:uncharacterized protein YjbI with pentapeptide repeats
MLREGIDGWNRWRHENPEISPKLNGTRLLGANLESTDLRKADLRGVDFGPEFIPSVISSHGAIMPFQDGEKPRVKLANLANADLRRSDLRCSF